MHNPEANLGLDFDYTPLPAFSLHTRNHFQPLQGLSVSVSLYSDCVCLKVTATDLLIQCTFSSSTSPPLPPPPLASPFSCPSPSLALPTVAGVLYVHVHSGSDLVSTDPDNLSDPYCVVLANKKKVRNTLVSEDQPPKPSLHQTVWPSTCTCNVHHHSNPYY